MQGVDNYIPEANNISMVQTYIHADILWLQFMTDKKSNGTSHYKHFVLLYM